MENVLEVCRLPHDPRFPVVCLDESSKQLVGEVTAPIPFAPGRGRSMDHEYVRNGAATLFVEIEPLVGRRHVEAIKVRLVMDNLNPRGIASLYDTFPPAEARRLADRLEIHHTPKHGGWLNIAEIELSALSGQRLNRRIPDIASMRREVAAWQLHRNQRGAPINWRFTTEDARIKPTRLYPKLYPLRDTRPRRNGRGRV